MIAWENDNLVVSSLRTWVNVSVNDYVAAYKAMVAHRRCDRWMKIIDLSDFQGGAGDTDLLTEPETARAIMNVAHWSAQYGMHGQIIVLGENLKPNTMNSIVATYQGNGIATTYARSRAEAHKKAEKVLLGAIA